MKLEGKVAIVTGAGTGLGRAIAQRLAADGAAVTIADIAGAPAVAQALIESGAKAIATLTDVSDEAAVNAMVARTLQAWGRVDILVNNAAIASSMRLTPFEQLSLAEWRRMLEVNTTGPFLCARAVAPHLRAQRSGRIVNITSGTAFKGAPHMLHYVASKGALMTMTRALARELGNDHITVNAVSPGYTLSEGNLANTEFLDVHRAAAIASRALPRDAWPADIVGAVAFLASDDAAFISGQILAVDGGSVYH
jgi:NAD(P)-dependent dehydrogenase (short-subunit alcohol dehydrogenase family)